LFEREMPIYSYKAYGSGGELTEGQIEAASEQAAHDRLWSQKLVPFELVMSGAATAPWWRRELFAGETLSQSQLAAFTREFATLASAGIPLDDVLRILADQTSSAKTRPITEAILADVLNGGALSDAFEKQGRGFSPEYVSVIRAGEVSGRLGQALEELAALLESRAEARAKVQSALVYPVILIALSLVSLGVITSVLIPNIAPMFAEGGRPVPGTIRVLMSLHEFWAEILVSLSAILFASIGIGVAALRRPANRLAFDRFKLRLPIIGMFFLKRETARYTRTLGTLLKAGVPLLQAATSARTAVRNAVLLAGVTTTIDTVREGAPLHIALRRHTVLPPLALRMITIGEEAAKLDAMLLKVAAMFEQQTEHDVARFMTILTPAITLFVAVFIGALIVTIMNAILGLNDLAVQ
jgi:general secretion pathway protein F